MLEPKASNTKVVLELVKNPKYPQLGSASTRLQEIVKMMQALNEDSPKWLIGGEDLKNAETSIALAVDTVVLTMALFKTRVEIPKMENVAVRLAAYEMMRKLINDGRSFVGPFAFPSTRFHRTIPRKHNRP